MPNIEINTEEPDWKLELPEAEAFIKKACDAALNHIGIVNHADEIEVSVLLAGDESVRQLNLDYRGKNKPTNVLSFPSEELIAGDYSGLGGYIMLGDIIFALQTIKSEAITQGKKFADHLSHLVVHGLLHLAGYDHEKDEEAQIMESLEIAILAKLGIENPYTD